MNGRINKVSMRALSFMQVRKAGVEMDANKRQESPLILLVRADCKGGQPLERRAELTQGGKWLQQKRGTGRDANDLIRP